MTHPADRSLPSWLSEVPFLHRGLHGNGVPENSLPAFAAARDAGVGIELDVQATADGEAVVLHDRDLLRVTGSEGLLAELSLEDLREFRLLETDETVPTLTDVLSLVAGEVPVMVEIKNPTAGTGAAEEAVARALYPYRGPACVASFNPLTVAWMRRNAPRLLRLQTAGPLHDAPMPSPVRHGLRRLWWNRWTRPHGLSYDLRGLPSPPTTRWRQQGRLLITWTVTDAEDARHARDVADNAIVEPWALDAWEDAQRSSTSVTKDRSVSS